MIVFLSKRLVHSLFVLLLVVFCSYSLMGLMPGDPIDLMAIGNPDLTPADIARMKAQLGLDQPILVRFWNWLVNGLHGDFGYSRFYHLPAIDVILPAAWNTIKLVGLATILSILIAVPVGVFAALRPKSWIDYTIGFLSFVGFSTPAFFLALMLMLLFSVHLGWLPAGGSGEADGEGFWFRAKYMILPVLALTILSVASVSRYVRSSMLEVMRQDYIRTAKAKGASNRYVVWKHAIKNAMIPVVTIIALDFGTLLSGAVLTESVFAWPGMGKVLLDSLAGSDYNVALLCIIVITINMLLGNLLADVAYTKLDPRIDLNKGASA
ncbi:ABC transporter permease [Veronia pacifica]|uniref:Diguanylate cyclase n=1 Tax=Veronia pacifica TaxID=1080227 RepID=A0A1C3EBG1_9GAMM|nr:ABC transporter permease [Veronia pacifica]ODA30597.1 diguanylate cyclase [Veronia pacifica]